MEIVCAIQVCKSLGEENLGDETKKREIEGLIDAMRVYGLKEGLILTEDEEGEEEVKDKEGNKYKVIIKPVWKWVLK